MKNNHSLRHRCPVCKHKRRFHEPPGDQGGTRKPKANWEKIDNVWICIYCINRLALVSSIINTLKFYLDILI